MFGFVIVSQLISHFYSFFRVSKFTQFHLFIFTSKGFFDEKLIKQHEIES